MKSGDRQKTTEREGTKGMQTARTGSKKQQAVKKKPVKKLLTSLNKVDSRNKHLWAVQVHIGSGGFGDVYRVIDEKDPERPEYAMKTEIRGAHQRRLNIEKCILHEVGVYTASNKKTRHFCELVDSGLTAEYSWIVMTLIGPSLDSVRRMLNKQFTRNCVISMALQILEAVEIMHEVGFIHRDLKPGNICTGNPPNDDHLLYVLDFGISRRIYKSITKKELRNKRERVPFYGTRKFCNRACHLEKDQGRKDDMETYVYTVLDLFHNERGLSWSKDLADTKKIVEKKKALFENPLRELDPIVPPGIAKIILYLKDLKFQDSVDYRFIELELRSCRKELTSSDPSDETMDWTGKLEKLMKEAKNNKKPVTPKGEETLIFENLKERKRVREMTSAGGGRSANESSAMRSCTFDGSEGPPPGFMTTGATTAGTTGGTTGPATRTVMKKPLVKKKSRSRN
ncbi:hypothetical protein CRE_24496 [Caenorhabditis remanei]|uniref:non-specific serine/threonine protein kinase n=1 Tax=Caenorhabditis remanei TaxID=31234 RepID=E3MFX8_CAERE|nr:hypothetical protein CRE_24496 [Caenorhabditis remanei]